MSRFKLLLAAAITVVATAAFAITQQLDQSDSRFAFSLPNGIVILPKSLLTSDAKIDASKVTRSLGASATIDFSSASTSPALSSSITVTGARAGDPCFVGVPTAAAALQAEFACFVDAADSVKVQFTPRNQVSGTATLNGASPSVITATVPASSVCTCGPLGATAAIAAGGCATGVSSTTLTMTSANGLTNVVAYDCAAPVDPASGTFYVRVISSQAN